MVDFCGKICYIFCTVQAEEPMTVKMEDRVPVARFFSLVWEKRKLQILEFFPHGVGQGGLQYKAIQSNTDSYTKL